MKMLNIVVFHLLLFELLCTGIGATSPRVHLYSKDRKLILKLHNDFRRSVGATNMMELVWDYDAANEAAEWSGKCLYKVHPDNEWGQNMNQFAEAATEALSPVKIIRDSFKEWSKEGKMYDHYNKDYKNCGTKHTCSIVQLLTAEVKGVGCALMMCPDLNMTNYTMHNAQLYVCFYTPRVNLLGQAPYAEGIPCSACGMRTKCIKNLCAEIKDKNESVHMLLEAPEIHINVDSDRRLETKGHQTNFTLPDGGVKETGRDRQDAFPYYANVVIPFPGPEERRDVRLLARMERRNGRQHSPHSSNSHHRKKTSEKQTLSELTSKSSVDKAQSSVRRKRQTDEYVRRRNEYYREEERRRQQTLQALRDRKDGLTEQEQYFTIAAHNVYRKQERLNELTWSSRLERWAKYVIRCDREYPGPITCYTNFGKSGKERNIYTAVYDWAAEGPFQNNIRLETGCRTPADKTVCNHNTVIRNPDISEMACASMDCGTTRQLTCIYH
ncbi:hypothetical protein CHS0354_033113 [Potamilus streckersoni]|uniref:SCP domain-containing protein n=1 Tax=Potamilus streckersoni TaxID=2493646 RepID=A0AAE0S5Z2_9BIVA|nr:hypothetical protein CHS0354_033113 [Potamilus streckersoni]